MTTSDFLELVRRSQLVEEDPLAKFLDEFSRRNGGRTAETAEKLAAGFIAANMLTEWQADKLLANKHKGFFLGKYKLLRQLGKGGMSTVYLAEHMLMKRKVAIKVLPHNRVEDATYLERFRIEARAAARLDDPNIVRVYDIDQDANTHYIVMEYVEGQDLHQLVKEKGPLPYEKAADYVAQVARGLAHAHRMGLIHRDIKPANCLLDKHEVVKLLDMGLARLIDDEASLTLDNNENVLGTADYLAPEQALNSHKADTRADIYSLGCTMYFLLTGHPPFPDGSISERLLKHQMEQAPTIFKDRHDAPSLMVNICNRMMAKRPEERFQTADEVSESLVEWLNDRGLSPGDSGRKLGSGGVGSDVFKRFSAALAKAGGDSKGKMTPGSPGSGAPISRMPEEEIGLAPLEEETPKESREIAKAEEAKEKSEIKKKDDAAEKAGSDPGHKTKVEAATGVISPPAKPKPARSLIEEEIAVGNVSAPSAPKPMRREGEFDPLRPPGFTGPTYGTPGWVYVLVGLGIVTLIGVIVVVALWN